MKNNKGFTLIELMITVAIIGILAAVALPAYQDYTIRSQVTEGLSLTSGAKVSVVEYYANHGVYPTSNTQLGYSGASGKYVSEVNIGTGGIVVATFGGDSNEQLKGKRVLLHPSNSGTGPIEIANVSSSLVQIFSGVSLTNNAVAQETPGWGCFSDVEQKYLPSSCLHREIEGGPAPTEPSNPTTPVEPPPVTNPDGSITYPNGTTVYPNGDIKNSDGSIKHTDGSTTAPNGVITLTPEQEAKYGNLRILDSVNKQRMSMTDYLANYNYYREALSKQLAGQSAPGSISQNATQLKSYINRIEAYRQYVGSIMGGIPADLPATPPLPTNNSGQLL